MNIRTIRTLAVGVVAALALGLYVGFLYGKEKRTKTHELLNAVLWMQSAQEYRMAVTQAFRQAEIMVERALLQPDWTALPGQEGKTGGLKKAAVILDADETILDNSPFQGQMILDDDEFHLDKWFDWEVSGKPRLLPGARAFLERMKELKVKIFYVTNRSHKHSDKTLELFRDVLKIPIDDDGANLLSRDKPPTKGGDKQSRRDIVAGTHRVLLLIGDDLNDFVSGVRGEGITPEKRKEIAEGHEDKWGRKWIVIPNPAYGSWERAHYGFRNDLTRAQRLEAKYRSVAGR